MDADLPGEGALPEERAQDPDPARDASSSALLVMDVQHGLFQKPHPIHRSEELLGTIDLFAQRFYDDMDGCVGWDPAFQVTNTGSVTFRSYDIEAYDTVADVTKRVSVDHFDETSGCPVVTAIPQLDPGMTGWVHAYSFHYDPTGNPLQVSVTLCTDIGLGGTCITQSLNVTP